MTKKEFRLHLFHSLVPVFEKWGYSFKKKRFEFTKQTPFGEVRFSLILSDYQPVFRIIPIFITRIPTIEKYLIDFENIPEQYLDDMYVTQTRLSYFSQVTDDYQVNSTDQGQLERYISLIIAICQDIALPFFNSLNSICSVEEKVNSKPKGMHWSPHPRAYLINIILSWYCNQELGLKIAMEYYLQIPDKHIDKALILQFTDYLQKQNRPKL